MVGNVESKKSFVGERHYPSWRGEGSTNDVATTNGERWIIAKHQSGKEPVAPLTERDVGEGLVFADEGHAVLEKKTMRG